MLAGSDDLHRGPASMAAPHSIAYSLTQQLIMCMYNRTSSAQATAQLWHWQEAIGMHQGYAQKGKSPYIVTTSVGLLVVRLGAGLPT